MLANVHVHGNLTEPGSFAEADRRILSTPRHLRAFQRAFGRLPVNLEVHFVHLDRDLSQPGWSYYHEDGTKRLRHLVGTDIGFLTPEHITRVYGVEIRESSSALTAVFVENFGGRQPLPFTTWMVMHRLGHLLFQRNPDPNLNLIWDDFINTMRGIGGLYWCDVLNHTSLELTYSPREIQVQMSAIDVSLDCYFGTSHAARNGTCINETEWFFDCFAQLYMTGAISFRRAQRQLISLHGSRPNVLFVLAPTIDSAVIDEKLTGLATRLKQTFDGLLTRNVGRIGVL